jgi:DNA polymerase-3 subunit delta'
MLPWLASYQQQLAVLVTRAKLAHGLLFTGPQGIGKQQLADYLAALLLCPANDKPCGQCKSCLLRQAGNHPDLLVIDSSNASIGIEAIRQLGQFMAGRAQQQQNKVVLLAQADKLTEPAANALLKTLEEPPQHSFIILHSARPDTLAQTLISRCQRWDIAAQYNNRAHHWLQTHSNRAVPDFLLDYCAGAPLKALALLESGEAEHIQLSFNALDGFFADRLSLPLLLKQLDKVSEMRALLGWYLRRTLLPAHSNNGAKTLALHQLYSRWCRDETQILGQNKALALSALLTALKKLAG